jgi:glycosyltransferase involved in cell wall biosynthesis
MEQPFPGGVSKDSTSTSDAALDVTVVIPAFNRELSVARAVISAINQVPSPPREVIVIDDGSEDGTAKQAAWAGARVLRQANRGDGEARNAGLRACNTRWVAFLDSDDEWLSHHLAALTQWTPGNVLIGTNARAVPSGRLVGHPQARPFSVTSASMLWPDSPLSISATLVNRQAALDVGGFKSIRLGTDRDFWCRLLELGPGILLPVVTCIYHEHSGQISGNPGAMRTARTSVVAAFQDRDWFDPLLLQRLAVVSAWDELRESQSHRNWRSATGAACRLLGNRATPMALFETLRYRSRLRRL